MQNDTDTQETNTFADLLRQKKDLEQKIQAMRKEKLRDFKTRILAEAKELEIDPLILLNPPKYKNPTNPNEYWRGSGRTPDWLNRLVASGMSEDELINPEWEPPED